MTNTQLIKEFLTKEKTKGVYCHLAIYNGELINYSTTIAKWDGQKLYINTRKYSRSTTKIQNDLICIANRLNIAYEKYQGENCTYWNFGYVGAATRTMADIREWERLDERLAKMTV